MYGDVHKSIDSKDVEFTIDKESGFIVGNKLRNVDAKSIDVIDNGAPSKVYKVISIFSGGTIQLFQLFDHYDGEYKPFSLIENNTYRYGVCK